jgi:hypothetical protein
MKYDLAFPRKIVLVLLAIGLVAVYPLYTLGDRGVTTGFVAGGLISFMNVLAGYFSIEYAFDKPNTTFLKIILGGMGIRLLAIAAIFFLLIKVFDFHALSLTASLFFFYFLFVIFEILFVNKKLALKKSPS